MFRWPKFAISLTHPLLWSLGTCYSPMQVFKSTITVSLHGYQLVLTFGFSFHIYIETKEDAFMNLALEHAGNQLLHKLIEATSSCGLMQCQHICLDNALFLTKHPYAKFVVTRLIQGFLLWCCLKVCLAFAGHVFTLGCHQCGSRVKSFR